MQNQAGVERKAWAELSPPQRKEYEDERGGGGRRGGGVGGAQVRRGKNPCQGESLDKDSDKTDSTTTNKQDPQDTPAGRRIGLDKYCAHIYTCT